MGHGCAPTPMMFRKMKKVETMSSPFTMYAFVWDLPSVNRNHLMYTNGVLISHIRNAAPAAPVPFLGTPAVSEICIQASVHACMYKYHPHLSQFTYPGGS